jgi:hypothetical protein
MDQDIAITSTVIESLSVTAPSAACSCTCETDMGTQAARWVATSRTVEAMPVFCRKAEDDGLEWGPLSTNRGTQHFEYDAGRPCVTDQHNGFPPPTIRELQIWSGYLDELKRSGNRRVAALWQQLRAALGNTVPLPVVVPGADTGVANLCWDIPGQHLEITISVDGASEWFYMDRTTRTIREGNSSDGGIKEFVALLGQITLR